MWRKQQNPHDFFDSDWTVILSPRPRFYFHSCRSSWKWNTDEERIIHVVETRSDRYSAVSSYCKNLNKVPAGWRELEKKHHFRTLLPKLQVMCSRETSKNDSIKCVVSILRYKRRKIVCFSKFIHVYLSHWWWTVDSVWTGRNKNCVALFLKLKKQWLCQGEEKQCCQ